MQCDFMTSHEKVNTFVNKNFKKVVSKQRIGANMEICSPRYNRKIMLKNNLKRT